MTVAVDIAGTGFTVLDRVYPSHGEAYETLGGSCGNVLISLAMLERTVWPLLLLGADEVGEQLVSEFKEAGVETKFIFQRTGIGSPVLVQQVDVGTGQHSFSFICPLTEASFPSYRPIDSEVVRAAEMVLTHCAVFYADRLSESIVDAMETAASAGAVIYFEPSAIGDWRVFERAMRVTSILKFSAERIGQMPSLDRMSTDAILIMTKGVDGLELRQGGAKYQCDAFPAPVVRDTCGSGDMVSVGVIDRLLARRGGGHAGFLPEVLFEEVAEGVSAGQRLAAANCAHVGARGVFRQRGVEAVRRLLDGPACVDSLQSDLFEGTSCAAPAPMRARF